MIMREVPEHALALWSACTPSRPGRRLVTRPAIMAGQLRRLLAVVRSPHATVRVIPEEAVFF
jgi:hypothetical protein